MVVVAVVMLLLLLLLMLLCSDWTGELSLGLLPVIIALTPAGFILTGELCREQ